MDALRAGQETKIMHEPFLTGVLLGAIIGALLTVLIMSLMFSIELQWREIDE